MSMKINRLEIENVKRIKAVKIEPRESGLTLIGGNNNQGKTSVLDSIAWALGGERFKPSQATREGSVIPPNLHIVMNNGLVVERKGKNSALKVTDPNGTKADSSFLTNLWSSLPLISLSLWNLPGKKKHRHFFRSLEWEISLYNWKKKKKNCIRNGYMLDVLQIRKKSLRKSSRIFRKPRKT